MKLSIIASASLLPTWITFSEASFPPYFPSHLPPEVALPPLKTLTFQTDFQLSCHFYPNAHPFQKVQKRAYFKKKWRNTIYHRSHQIHFRSSEQRTRTRPLELYGKKQGAPSVNLYAFWPTTQWQHNQLSATFEIIYRASFQSQLKVDHPPACETPVQMFLTAVTHWFISVHEWCCDSSRQCFTCTAHTCMSINKLLSFEKQFIVAEYASSEF